MRLQIYRRADNDFGVRLLGENGEPVAAWEGYASEGNARRAVDRVIEAFTTGQVEVEEGVQDG